MKYSRYNFFYKKEQANILYNTYSDKMLALMDETYMLIRQYQNDIDILQHVHPQLYEALKDGLFIIDNNTHEYERTVSELKQQTDNADSVHLTINPTLDCNFRCWYCYEKHNEGSYMDCVVVDSVRLLITNILSRPDISKLVLSFFGGEPLMYFQEIMLPILSHANHESKRLGKHLNVYITTNGYFLSTDKVIKLKEYEYVSLQIPFDGNRELHNKTKFLKGGEKTFDQVVKNALTAIESGIDVIIRCNYTYKNIDSFIELSDSFGRVKDNENLEFAFHKIWQEKQSPELEEKFMKVFNTLMERGFLCDTNVLNKGMCYADYKDNAVINFNGDVYKCTARDFTGENKLGELQTDGTIRWNETYYKRLSCKYKSKACMDCQLFPVCMQGCSQKAFENDGNDDCIFGYSKDDVEATIKARIDFLMTRCNTL